MIRIGAIVCLGFRHLLWLAVEALFGNRLSFRAHCHRTIRILCERFGGAFPKIGQILSTRADLVPEDLRRSLRELQDNVAPLPESHIKRLLSNAEQFGAFRGFRGVPVASATVAQVHHAARADDGRIVAVKLIRPSVRGKLVADCRIIRFFGSFIAKLPRMASIPVNEALWEATDMLIAQTDFRHEARNHLRLHRIFSDTNDVIVPTLHRDLCTDDVLVMDFISGMKKLSDPTLPDDKAKDALKAGVRALFKMIFQEGFIHCDMHPGNVLVAPDGRLVILDAGFMVELSDSTRRSFAEFFLAIAFRDGPNAARIVCETALRLPPDLDVAAFDSDIAALISRVGGLRAREFQVAGFVGELFAIMRQHRIYGTSQFTLVILALLVYEGVTKQRYPDLDFQQEAIPFVMAALAQEKPARSDTRRDATPTFATQPIH